MSTLHSPLVTRILTIPDLRGSISSKLLELASGCQLEDQAPRLWVLDPWFLLECLSLHAEALSLVRGLDSVSLSLLWILKLAVGKRASIRCLVQKLQEGQFCQQVLQFAAR